MNVPEVPYQTNRRRTGLGDSDITFCPWVFLSLSYNIAVLMNAAFIVSSLLSGFHVNIKLSSNFSTGEVFCKDIPPG